MRDLLWIFGWQALWTPSLVHALRYLTIDVALTQIYQTMIRVVTFLIVEMQHRND